MNWRRGLFRLWVVGSVLFVIAVAFVSYSDIKADFDAVARASKPVTDPKLIEQLETAPRDRKPFDPDEFLARFDKPNPNPWASLGRVAAIALGIPLVVLALGSSLVWAFSGFAATRN